MLEMITWKQFIEFYFSFGKKLNFCAITKMMGTDTKRVKELTRHATMAQSAARKSHNPKVVNLSLIGRS